jgi:hypothetical protein
MTKPLENGGNLPKAPCEKQAFKLFTERLLDLRSDSSIVDLDIPALQHALPEQADVAIWLDTWHVLVDALGSSEDAELGIRTMRSALMDVSTKVPNMLFSADTSKPPLDQFGSPSKSLELLFRESTCYKDVKPVAIYRGRKVYWGSNPSSSHNREFAQKLFHFQGGK